MLAIIKKELNSYFKTPIGYIYLAAFMAMYGIFFLDFFKSCLIGGTSGYFHYTLGTMVTISTFLIPILTMKLFAEERKQGTELMLLSSPTTTISIVVGKFLAASIIVIISIILTLILGVAIMFCTKTGFNYTALLSTYIGFVLLSMCYISMGMLFSIFTENQIIAYVISLVAALALWFVPGLSNYAPTTRYDLFVQGAMAWKDIIFLITFIIAFLSVNVVFLENRKWNK